MSVDLGDPEIARIRGQVLDGSDPTTWFLCHYSPSATTPSLSLVSSGSDPIIPQWREQLNKLKSEGDEVAFGYGEFKGKGCVVHFLSDQMSGVKRARAVVHSRAFASLFPDYSALITIADPSQLTQELINEKLGLDYIAQQTQPAQTVQQPTGTAQNSSPSTAARKDDGSLPPAPQQTSNPPAVPAPNHHTLPQQHPNSQSTPLSSHAQSGSTDFSPSRQPQPNVPAPQRPRHVSESGSGSEPQPERQRKVSLTTRLGKAFGNPGMQGRTSDQSAPSSPGSPASTSKFKSSITKAFRRTSAEPAPSDTRSDSPDAPPVPPKDEPSPRRPSVAPGPGQYCTPSGGLGYSPASAEPSPRSDSLPHHVRPLQANGGGSPGSLTPSNTATQNHSTMADTRLSPSPSAQRVFTEARIKSLNQEEEIQNRFRRDLHLDESGNADRPVVDLNDDPEEDLRLPYDVSDDKLSDHTKEKQEELKDTDSAAGVPPALQLGRPLALAKQDPGSTHAADDRPQQDTTGVSEIEHDRSGVDALAPATSQPASEHITPVAGIVLGRSGENTEQDEPAAEPAQLEDGDVVLQNGDAGDAAEQAEAMRKTEEAAQAGSARLESEEAERARIEAEDLARQQREREEEEARAAKEAEDRRIQEEEAARRKAEEEERERLALEEQKRIEEIRLKEEEERRRVEEEKRIQAEKEEAQRTRKASIKQSLLDGKSSGGVMLRGYVTVQTTKSMIWRRRYFHLQSGEMHLFKSEGDDKPIQTVHLGPKAEIEHTYEESQVQGSWKILSDGQDGREEFFVFADSPDEKETILEGLQLAIS